MKTQTTLSQNNILRSITSSFVFVFMLLASNSVSAQTKASSTTEVQNKERTVKGIVKDDSGPVEGATIVLKDTNVAINTDERGMFTFPQKLKIDDELVIIHLGYKDQEIIIKPETSFVDVTLSDYDITIMGSLMIGDNNTLNKN